MKKLEISPKNHIENIKTFIEILNTYYNLPNSQEIEIEGNYYTRVKKAPPLAKKIIFLSFFN